MQTNYKSYYDLVNGALGQYGFDSMQTFIDSAFANRYDNASWKSAFDWGIPKVGFTYTQLQGTSLVAPKATIIEFDADKPLRAPSSFSLSTGKMPRMGHAIQFNEESFIQQAQLVTNYSGVVPRWEDLYKISSTDTDKLLRGMHSQLNYMAFQIESTGHFITNSTNNPDGLQGLDFDFNIPAANKKKVVKVWSDSTADVVTDLYNLVKYAKDNFKPYGVLRMNRATWDIIWQHPTVRNSVAIQATMGGIAAANVSTFFVTEDQIRAYLLGRGLPPIEVVDEISFAQTFDVSTRKTVNTALKSFADGVVVLRAAGTCGSVESSLPIKFNNPAEPVYTYEDGRITILQTVSAKHKVMEFIAEFTGIPVLNNPNEIMMLDITTAA